jgi:hypothetical protein
MTDALPNRRDEACASARRALFAFLLTFVASRVTVLLIMSGRVPNMYFFLSGTHVHHLNYGIFLLAGVGAYLVVRRPAGREARTAAVAYGVAIGLTFDEFGMWLHLGGSYWQRASVDAVLVVAAILGLASYAPAEGLREAARPRGDRDRGLPRPVRSRPLGRGQPDRKRLRPAPEGAGVGVVALTGPGRAARTPAGSDGRESVS